MISTAWLHNSFANSVLYWFLYGPYPIFFVSEIFHGSFRKITSYQLSAGLFLQCSPIFQEEMDASIDMDPAALSLFFLFHASFQEGHHKDRAFLPVVLPTRIASQSFQRPAQETPQVFPRTEVQCILAVLLFFQVNNAFQNSAQKFRIFLAT